MSTLDNLSVTIQITTESKPSIPAFLAEVTAFAQVLAHTGNLKTIQEQVRFARARFGRYDLVDFVAVLIGYILSGEPTLEHDPKKYLEATLDLSFASAKWQRTVMVRRKRKSRYIRQHLETCVFSYVAEELKTRDLCVAGPEQYADYRDQLLSWEECEPKVAAYCHQLRFPMTAEGWHRRKGHFLPITATFLN